MSEQRYKEYSNGKVTIVWKPKVCIHSGICVRGLPKVFRPKEKPWINTDAAGTEALVDQVKQCPSGALSYYRNDGQEQAPTGDAHTSAEVVKDGPLMVHGHLKVKHANGVEEEQQRVTAFCRCGASTNKPYCDGSHKKTGFKG